ncbi:polymerase [Brasilonema octagenarum UFV-E1]|uniref:Polymerase n=1 Tax=Brasilonema sennae CENA114 TaxID=415709 RepID=A0A856MH27_9CYAN|nr:O-antigen ligase family protein [Brasilonema sennae]QDL09509.1 polymerase [Brasilonema sennae CENA114]QDL15865.1 polymerase [Brasilonema octagenarum UFV-E1]
MLGTCLKTAFRHPNPSLQSSWNYAQLGILVFPLLPFLGAVGIVLAILGGWFTQYRAIIRRPLHWGFALLSVFMLITVSFANDKTAAFLGLFNFLPYFLVFVSFSTLIQTPVQLRQMSWILVLGSLPVVILGFGQLFLNWSSKIRILWFVVEWEIEPGGQPVGRMASVFMYANINACYLMIVFILGIGLWLESYRRMRRRADKPKDHPGRNTVTQGGKLPTFPHSLTPSLLDSAGFAFFFLTVAMIAIFVALILTDSRNAWAIAIFACLAYAVYEGWHILVAGVAGIVASVLCAAFAPLAIAQLFRKVVPAFFWARLNDQLYPDRPIALLRKTQWQFALSLTQQRPWTGWGLRNFTPLYDAQMHIWLGHPHNLFLMLFAETGFPTTLLFCGLLVWIFIGGVQVLQKLKSVDQAEDKLICFSYLLVFVGWVLFNTADVSLFDFRLNTLSWLLLAAISGVVYRHNYHQRLAVK